MEEARGVPPDERREGILGEGAAKLLSVGGTSLGNCPKVRPVLFLLMWFVISFLNCSRSMVATGGGFVKVKVCPSANEYRTSLSFTWAAPALLHSKAAHEGGPEPTDEFTVCNERL